MYRQKTRTEEKRERDEVIRKKIEESSGYGHQNARISTPSSEVMQERMRREEEDTRQAKALEEYRENEVRLKEEALKKQLDAIKSGTVDTITPHELYERATTLYDQGDKLSAAQTFWAAFACGERKAAYDLYKMFYLGDGINKNIELATVMGIAWSMHKDPEDVRQRIDIEGTLAKKGCITPVDALRRACSGLPDEFSNGVTNELIDMQLESFNEIIRQKGRELKCNFSYGGSLEYYMTHPEEGQEVVVAGDGSHCVLL